MNKNSMCPIGNEIILTDRVLSMKEVKIKTGLSKSTIYSQINQGMFPEQIKLGIRRVGWSETDIAHWLHSKKLQNRTGASDK